MSYAVSILGGSVLTVLLAGYLAQQYLPPPKPKIVGIDLGTTFSCVGIYHAVTGRIDVIKDKDGHSCIPSIVAFRDNEILTGYEAEAQIEQNVVNTIYDAKRFIGKHYTETEFLAEKKRYPFKIALKNGLVYFPVTVGRNTSYISPEEIGAHIIKSLKKTAEKNLTSPVTKAVISVPAEFDELQRNFTRKAAEIAGLQILRIINEPTAAALAYGVHKRKSMQYVMVVDLGGGTLDVSLLFVQGGMFITQAMAGNNHLGGQDFNQRLFLFLLDIIKSKYKITHFDPIDLQKLRNVVETVKLQLSISNSTNIAISLQSLATDSTTPIIFEYTITKDLFEKINEDLFEKILEPITKILEHTTLSKSDIDEVVLVGGSTRIPKVREILNKFFNKIPNTSVDPEIAVVSGVSIQAGILGGMWPLTVSATELPIKIKKIQL